MAGRPPKKVTTETKSVEKVETKPIVEETKTETVIASPPPTRKQVVQIDKNELIPCRSVVFGNLTYKSPRTGLEYRWFDYGAEEFIEYGELITLKSSSPKFLMKPWLIVMDETATESLRLTEMYKTLLPLDDIMSFLSKPFTEIETKFKAAPIGMKQTFAQKVRQLMEEGKVENIKIINMIDKEMGTGLKDFIQ
jgi:hypothetical protein